jgi:uncharacterized protein YndB with AHSA1/START domain
MTGSHAANSHTFKVTTPNANTIVMTRMFDAPRQLVFEAMTKPEHVRRWWGILDDTYSMGVCEIDLRVGGRWRYVGRGPHGDGPEFYGEYREITPPSRLVYTEIFADFPDVPSLITTELVERQGQTQITLTCEYPSQDVRDMVMATGMESGAAITYDRLEDVVVEMKGQESKI